MHTYIYTHTYICIYTYIDGFSFCQHFIEQSSLVIRPGKFICLGTPVDRNICVTLSRGIVTQ